jgi:hypothetical protein
MARLSDGRVSELIDYAEEAVKKQPEDATKDMLSALCELMENRKAKTKRTISSIVREIDLKMEEMEATKDRVKASSIWREVEELFGEAWRIAGKIRKQE